MGERPRPLRGGDLTLGSGNRASSLILKIYQFYVGVEMFNVRYSDGATLKKYLYGVVKPLSEVPLKVTESEFVVRGLSPDKSVMVEAYIPSQAFEVYSVSTSNTLVLDRDEFNRVLKRFTKRDSVTFSYEDGKEEMSVVLTNTKTGAERSYAVRVISLEEPVEALNVELHVLARLESEILKKLISDAALVGDELEIDLDEDKLTFKVSSENRGYVMTLEQGKHLLELKSELKDVRCVYDIDLLKSIASALAAVDIATLEFGSGLPLKITLVAEEGVKLTFWVAPRG